LCKENPSRNLNDLVNHQSFHMQAIATAVQLSTPGSVCSGIDIRDCLLSFPVYADSQRYLAFGLDGKFLGGLPRSRPHHLALGEKYIDLTAAQQLAATRALQRRFLWHPFERSHLAAA
jgi:hypothetical protein